MTCREYAKAAGFQVVGQLHRVSVADYNRPDVVAMWVDDGGNEYWRSRTGDCVIVSVDGGVL